MDNRNNTDSLTDLGNRSLVCDYVKGILPAHLIAEVKIKIASDRLFAAEVDYYEALHQIINSIKEAFGEQSKERIDASIRSYYHIAGIDEQELIDFTELVEKEYQYRRLEHEPLIYEGLQDTIHRIKKLNQHLLFLEDTVFEKYIHLIPEFVNGNINPVDKDALKKIAAGNTSFKRELEHQREIAYTVRRMEREALKLQLAKLRPQPIAAARAAQASGGITTSGWSKRSTYTSIAAAILLVVGSAALFYFYSGSGRKQDVADNQAVNPGPLNPPSSSDTAADTAAKNDFKTGTAVSDQLWLERKMAVNTFKFTGENFGFAGNKELTVKLFRLKTKAGSDAPASYYVYVSSTVSLYLADTSTVSLYTISQEDLELAEEKMKAGLYLYMNDNFYLLMKDGNRHYLQPVNPIQSAYLKQNL
jgi:hypothetical protein